MKYKIILLIVVSIFIAGCGKTPIFTEMKTNRLKIVIKGTLETEGPSNFVTMESFNDDTKINSTPFQDDSVVEVSNSSSLTAPSGVDPAIAKDVKPTTFMLDIAEIRLNGKKISNYRQVFSIPLSDTEPFFDGTGIELTTDDPGAGNYDSLQLYIRKMVFDNAKVYQLVGNTFSYEKDAQVIFHEKTISGFDFNQFMVNSYWDSLRLESSEIIRVFPVQIPIIGGMSYTSENGETVLEIRLVVKNFIKKYEHGYYDSGVYKVLHYYALSDWLRDVKAGESDIGRNLHAVARAYVPGRKGTVSVTAQAGDKYVFAIPVVDSVLADYTLTGDGKTIRSAVVGDFPLPPSYPGAYIEPVLDYYLKYEKYKSDWNVVQTGCNLLSTYETNWNTYETSVKGDTYNSYGYGLKIAPYIAYTSLAGGTITFSNMQPGDYIFYSSSVPGTYGYLFSTGSFHGGTTKTINEGSNTPLSL